MAAALSDYSLFDPATLAEPLEFYAALRREAPVHRDPTGIYLVSTYDLVVEAARQPEIFSNRFAAAMAGQVARDPASVAIANEGWPPVDTMLTADPPEQKRFRSLVSKGFSKRRVTKLVPRIEAIADELLEQFAARGRVELRSEFAVPLPLTVISEQLGVPAHDIPQFKKWSDGFVAQLSQMANQEEQLEAARMIVEFQHYFAKVVDSRAEAPQDDIITDLVHARVEGERPLDMAETLSILQQLLVAGNETTASTISEGMWQLVRHPDQLAKVRENQALVPGLVEEVLRLATPTANMWRVAKVDSELGGVEIPAGSFVMLRYASANRDESVFPDPDRFDVERANASEHIAFGKGIHFCLGAELARAEMTAAFPRLIERLRNPRLAADATPPRYMPNILLHGLESLELEFDPA
ncbi:MAG: cytochrome P450 [Myxococcales bacterium]|nr:cytochrome P450 [Myxococcales bacterium]